ncbi:ankyrin, partial [Colletotrichum sublineola]
LSWAAENGHESMVKMLLEGGDDPNIRNGDDSTSLSWAAENGHESVVKVLLEGGADPNIRNG